MPHLRKKFCPSRVEHFCWCEIVCKSHDVGEAKLEQCALHKGLRHCTNRCSSATRCFRLDCNCNWSDCDGGGTRGHNDEAQCIGSVRGVRFCRRDPAGSLLSFFEHDPPWKAGVFGNNHAQHAALSKCKAIKDRRFQPAVTNKNTGVIYSGIFILV